MSWLPDVTDPHESASIPDPATAPEGARTPAMRAGECEVRGDDIGEITAHIGAGGGAPARANEVLLTRTLRDLVIGSGLEFDDRGAHQLKGLPGEWRLLAVTSTQRWYSFSVP